MKKWYCPSCKVFKRISKVSAGVMGYPDTNHCRCCGTELINAKIAIKRRNERYIARLAESITSKRELRECPFCGCENVQVSSYPLFNGEQRYAVICVGCLTSLSKSASRQEAVDRWNRRIDNV
jgi:Lar family restriction alleviation protein